MPQETVEQEKGREKFFGFLGFLRAFALYLITTLKDLTFLRTLVLLAKRFSNNFRNIAFIPNFSFISDFLQFFRPYFGIVIYLFDTKNKNLGKTRKFVFYLFKIGVSIAAIAMLPKIYVAITVAFFAYNAVKLIDSTLVLFVSFYRHYKIDKNSLENKWKREQYWDNILKHMSISALVVPVTLASAYAFPGAGVMALITANFIIPFAIAIAGIITVVAIIYLCSLINQRFHITDANLKKECDANIKKMAWLIGICLLSFASVAIAVCLPVIAIKIIGVGAALCTIGLIVFRLKKISNALRQTDDENLKANYKRQRRNLLILFGLTCLFFPMAFFILPSLQAVGPIFLVMTLNSIDAVKSTYDVQDDTKIAEPRPANLTPINALVEVSDSDYYYRKNRTLYLNTKDNQANEIFLSKEGLVKLLELRYKSTSFGEKDKISDKKTGVINDLASVLYNKGTDEELVNALILGIIELNKDCQQLNGSKAKNIVENVPELEEELAELLDYMAVPNESHDNANLLIQLWRTFKAKDFKQAKRNDYSQSFFKHTADCDDFSRACQASNEIKQTLSM